MTEDETRELERELWLAHAAMEAFANALPGLDPATLEDLATGGHDAVEAARAADPLWRLYLWFTDAWEAVGDAAEDLGSAPPEVVEAARAMLRVARDGTATAAASPAPPTVTRHRDVYVRARHFATAGETRDLGDGVHVDLGEDGEVLGVEVLGAVDLTVDGVTLPGVNPLEAQLEASERLRAGLRARLGESRAATVTQRERATELSDLLRGMARRASSNRRVAATLAREHAATDQAALGTFRELRDGLEGLRQGLLAALNTRESAFDSLTLLRNLVGQRDALRVTTGSLRGELGDALARLEEATLRLADAEQEGSDALLTREAMGHDLVQARLERDAALTQRDNLDADRRVLWEKCERLQATNDELAPLAIDQRELAGRLEIAVFERDAHARTLDHVLAQLHGALGGRPGDASLAALPDALEQVGHLVRRSRQDALDDLAGRGILETRLDDVTRERDELAALHEADVRDARRDEAATVATIKRLGTELQEFREQRDSLWDQLTAVTRERDELRDLLHARASMEETLRAVALRALGRAASDQATVTLVREVEEILGNVKRASHRMRAELADARQAAIAALGLGGEPTAGTALADLVGELEQRLVAARGEVADLTALRRDDARDQLLTEGATEDQLRELETRNLSLRLQVSGLLGERGEPGPLEDRVAALLEDNRALTHRNSSLEQDNGELADQVSSLGETCEDLEQDVLRLQAHAGSLNATLDRVRAVLDRHDPRGHLPAAGVARRVAAALDTYAWLLAEATWRRDDAVRRRAGDADDVVDAVGGCTCPRFRDTGGVRVADLCCPTHGVDAGGPHDGPWEDDAAEARAPQPLAAPTEGRHVSDVLISQHGELTELRARVAALEAAADSCAECGYRGGRHHYWCAAVGGAPGVTTAPSSAWRRGERA